MNIKYLFLVIWIMSASSSIMGQDLQYEDYVYLDHIRSVQFHHRGLPTSYPIVDLGTSGRLRLAFDDILGGDRDYSYRIVHCDKDWHPSILDESEYMDGFNNEEINYFEYSRGTRTNYTHYELSLPNDDVQWRISGNYLLVVTDDESEELALSRRFMVVENKVFVIANLDQALKAGEAFTNQEIELTINDERLPIGNPQRELYLTVLQNGRWDNAQTNIQPKFSIGHDIHFDRTSRIGFKGYNEFRGIDLRSLRTRGYGVNSVDVTDTEIIMVSELAKKRSRQIYSNYNDINGSYIIESKEYREDDIRSDYIRTFFAIESTNMLIDGQVYVVGKFTDWKLLPEWRMDYDFDKQYYYTDGLLKQGFYDFQFVVHRDDETIDIEHFEGSHYATNNSYNLLIYYRGLTGRYDRIIGAESLKSDF